MTYTDLATFDEDGVTIRISKFDLPALQTSLRAARDVMGHAADTAESEAVIEFLNTLTDALENKG